MLASASCYASEDSFIRRFAKLSCVHDRECARAEFDMAWDDMRACRDDQEAILGHEIDLLGSGCEYEPDQGRECIHAAYRNRKNCDDDLSEITEACTNVWACAAGLEPEADPMAGAFEAALPRD